MAWIVQTAQTAVMMKSHLAQIRNTMRTKGVTKLAIKSGPCEQYIYELFVIAKL